MMQQEFIFEQEIEVSDKVFFKDDKIHIYDFKCFDGHAVGQRVDESDDAPETIHMSYPRLDDILADKDACSYILTYRGLYDREEKDIHYGDIMMSYGEISKELYN